MEGFVMPVETWSRTIPGDRVPFRWTHDKSSGIADSSSFWTLIPTSQTTTSFRSKRRDAENDAESELFGNGAPTGSRSDFMRRLRDSDRALSGDTGNEFYTRKQSVVLMNRQIAAGYRGADYVGPFMPNVFGSPFPPDFEPSQSQRDADGRLGFRNAKPTRQEAGLAQFILELRERFPSLVGSELLRGGVRPANFGKEYLNIEFGLKPLRSDIISLCQAIHKGHKIVDDFVKNSDAVVRSASLIRDESAVWNETVEPSYFGNPGFGSDNGVDRFGNIYSDASGVTRYDVVRQKSYFVGAFQYHVYKASGLLDKMPEYAQKANHLLGSNFTLETVYQLTPWSWLFDWFSDFDTFVSNVVALSEDSLVMKYGYVMHEVEATRYRTQSATLRQYTVPGYYAYGPTTCSSAYTYHSKRRTRSSPYGFAIDPGSFSVRQWAILGALGMTQGPRTLKLNA